MGDDFIFNAAPFLDWWDNTDGAMTEMVGENVLGLMENFGVVLCVQWQEIWRGAYTTPERFEE